jgi:hypothetical protein
LPILPAHGANMATQNTVKLNEVTDQQFIKAQTFVSSQHADFKNTCSQTAYIHIQWPNGGITNFVLRPSETHSLFIGTGGNPCGCYSLQGVVTDCGSNCGTIQGGYTYETC